jgi:RNA polymerase sigma factor (sigma-70 family)
MTPDCDLLRQYADQRDEAAFAEVVRRHLNWVYTVALRALNGNATLAEDVTQAVFTDLARKAGPLRRHTTVAGWLHTSVRFAAAKAIRDDACRRTHEHEASAMHEPTLPHPPNAAHAELRPLLDEAVGQLREPERDAVLLRFFEDKSYREVGDLLSLSENAARMRVERALDKLRGQFSRRGVTTTAALLASALGAHGTTTPVPAGWAGTIPEKSIAGAAAAGSTGILALTASRLATPKMLLVAAMLILLVVFVALRVNSAKPPSAMSFVSRNDANQIELPKTAPAPITLQASAPSDKPEATEDLGEISLTTQDYEGKTFTLSSGLIFSINLLQNNADGSINLMYGAYEPNKPQHMKSVAKFAGQNTKAPMGGFETSELNVDYTIFIMPGEPVVTTLANGEKISFTPITTVQDINNLGVINLSLGQPLKFTLHSGKIFTIELIPPDDNNDASMPLPPGFSPPPGVPLTRSDSVGELTWAIYPSAQDYNAKRPSSGGGGTPPRAGQGIQKQIGGNEIVLYTPKSPDQHVGSP